MKRLVGRLLSLLLLSMLGTAAMGEEALERYIVVLRDRFSPAATASERARPVAEPDIASLGGRVLQSRMNRRLVELPSGRAEELRKHPDVAYMQRVWDGVSAPPAEREPEPEVAAVAAPARVVAHDTTPSWTTGAYSYDPSGNIRAIGSDIYSYDTAGRLLQSSVSGRQDNYAYDAFGNLFNPLTAGKVDPATNRLRDTANPAKWPYSQAGHLLADADGRAYLYDALGMISGTTASDGERRMIYTADDERIAVVSKPGDLENEVTRVRVRNFSGQVLREFTKTSTDTEWTRDYVYADGRLVGGERQVAGTQIGYRHFHLDHLGSTRLITRGGDAARITDPKYLPFGGELESSIEEGTIYGYYPLDPIKFTGHERDYLDPQNVEGGDALDYMHARYYDGGVGRFLTVDPYLDFDRAMSRPQGWNRYTYVENNPINARDPDGRAIDVLIDAGSAAYGIGVMWKKALNGEPVTWVDNASVAVDLASAFIPGLTGGGAAIRSTKAVAEGGAALVKRTGNLVIEGKALQKELDFAKELVAKGNDVVVRGTGAQGGDLLINGTMFELKTLNAGTQNAVEKNIIRGLQQGDGRVIVDGRAAGLSHGNAIRAVQKLQRQGKLKDAQEIRVLSATGEYRVARQ